MPLLGALWVLQLTSAANAAPVVIAGDFNQLSDVLVKERTGLRQIVYQATRGQNVLAFFLQHCSCGHKAVVAYTKQARQVGKTTMLKTYRKISPDQHAAFTQYMATLDLSNSDVTGRPILMIFIILLCFLLSNTTQNEHHCEFKISDFCYACDEGQTTPEKPLNEERTN